MPKFPKIKKGHLITGEVEFTVAKCVSVPAHSTWYDYEHKIGTYQTIEQAADIARRGWQTSCEAGKFNETYKVYRHTKGKTAYSHGHFQLVNWPDFDCTRVKKSQPTAPAPVPGPL